MPSRNRVQPSSAGDAQWREGFTQAQFAGLSRAFPAREINYMNLTPAQLKRKAWRCILRDPWAKRVIAGYGFASVGLCATILGLPLVVVPVIIAYEALRDEMRSEYAAMSSYQEELRDRAVTVMMSMDANGQGGVVASYLAWGPAPAYGDFPPDYQAVNPNSTPVVEADASLPPPPEYTETAVPLTFVQPREIN